MADETGYRGLEEFGLISHLMSRLTQRLADHKTPNDADVRVGVGDDAAVLNHPTGMETLVTVDTMVQGIHFEDRTMSFTDVGYKGLVASLSDIAAMGGIPRHAVVSVAIPKTVSLAELEQLYDGIADACALYDCSIVGGDVVSITGPLVYTTTVLGAVPTGQALLRSSAQPGDLVFVTGTIGGSAGGLALLQGDLRLPEDDASLLRRFHQRPEPQITAGQILRACGASSCNDISDGLAGELNEIAKASGVRLRIDTERLPIPAALKNYARASGTDATDFAWYGGEDYQLVGTAPSLAFAQALSRCESVGIRLTQIGRVEMGDGVIASQNGRLEVIEPRGFNHFQ